MNKTLFPVRQGFISQGFGMNVQFYKDRFGITGGHNGTDIVSQPIAHGDLLFASKDGVVVRAYDLSHGSITAGFGLWLLCDPDENGICDVFIYWHTMSNLKCVEGERVKQGDILAYEGDSGSVFVDMQPVPDEAKGLPPYPGTHLHWGKFQVKKTKVSEISGKTLLTQLDGQPYYGPDGDYFEWLNFNDGMRGCVDPMLTDIIHYDQWLLEQVNTVGEAIAVVAPTVTPEQIAPVTNAFAKLVNWILSIIFKGRGN